MRHVLAALTRNALSLFGATVSLVSAVLMVSLLALELFGTEPHPYIGIIIYLMLPGIFLVGLVLIPWGIARERRRSETNDYPVLDFNRKEVRRRVLSLVAIGSISIIVLVTGTSKGISYMGSNQFCGTVCHTVMSPEFTVYHRSPHASVKCVECHVGSGTEWFVRSKLNGAFQLASVLLGSYEKPIPTPVHNLRPARETCSRCHWPAKFHSTVPKVITQFEEDRDNTEVKTILLLNVGGHDFGESQGIHWHVDPDIQVRYRSDPKRETIYEVELTREDGTVKRYHSTEEDPGEDSTSWRVMDCVDCHNRPAHEFYGPEEAVDLVLDRDFINTDLPFVRREGLRVIQEQYDSQEAAKAGIAAALTEFYAGNLPDVAQGRAEDIQEAGRVLGLVYESNVFPSMNIDWNSYPDHSGHDYGQGGCFRCHQGNHVSEDGEKISSNCSVCHTVVAWEEASPEILEMIPR